jgi:hypothetical protein
MGHPIRKLSYVAAVMLVSLAPWAHAAPRNNMTGSAQVVQMPEPASPALLAVDLLSVGALIFLVRRHSRGVSR